MVVSAVAAVVAPVGQPALWAETVEQQVVVAPVAQELAAVLEVLAALSS